MLLTYSVIWYFWTLQKICNQFTWQSSPFFCISFIHFLFENYDRPLLCLRNSWYLYLIHLFHLNESMFRYYDILWQSSRDESGRAIPIQSKGENVKCSLWRIHLRISTYQTNFHFVRQQKPNFLLFFLKTKHQKQNTIFQLKFENDIVT